jgi:upstream activation factor subunit UAF30
VKEEKPHSNGSPAETDEEMARRLQLEYDALTGNRASRSAGTSARTKKPKKKTPKRKSAEEVDSDGEPVKKKRAGGGGGAFNKELILSDSLAAFTGEARLSRPQTVKRIWDYVKGNDLQDSSDKRFILCDDKLKSVFHVDKLHMFT